MQKHAVKSNEQCLAVRFAGIDWEREEEKSKARFQRIWWVRIRKKIKRRKMALPDFLQQASGEDTTATSIRNLVVCRPTLATARNKIRGLSHLTNNGVIQHLRDNPDSYGSDEALTLLLLSWMVEAENANLYDGNLEGERFASSPTGVRGATETQQAEEEEGEGNITGDSPESQSTISKSPDDEAEYFLVSDKTGVFQNLAKIVSSNERDDNKVEEIQALVTDVAVDYDEDCNEIDHAHRDTFVHLWNESRSLTWLHARIGAVEAHFKAKRRDPAERGENQDDVQSLGGTQPPIPPEILREKQTEFLVIKDDDEKKTD